MHSAGECQGTREITNRIGGFILNIWHCSARPYTRACIFCGISLICFFFCPVTMKAFHWIKSTAWDNSVWQCSNCVSAILCGDISIIYTYLMKAAWVKLGESSRQLQTRWCCWGINEVKSNIVSLCLQVAAAHFSTGAFSSRVIHFKLADHFKHAVYMPHLPYITNLSSLTRRYVHILPYHRVGWKATVIDGMIELFPCTVTRGAITSN